MFINTYAMERAVCVRVCVCVCVCVGRGKQKKKKEEESCHKPLVGISLP